MFHKMTVLAAVLMLASANHARAGGCVIDASSISFGEYNPLSANEVPTVGSISYTCVNASGTVSIALTQGDSSSFHQRVMRAGGKRLAYNLYLDPAGTRVWGDGSRGTETYVAPAPRDGQRVTVYVYGRMRPRQGVPSGDYRDSVEAVIDAAGATGVAKDSAAARPAERIPRGSSRPIFAVPARRLR
jgi:spore coat protein U-like protein